MLDKLASAQDLARQSELCLNRRPWQDGGCCVIGAEEIPRVESGKVLKCSEQLIATDYVDEDGLLSV